MGATSIHILLLLVLVVELLLTWDGVVLAHVHLLLAHGALLLLVARQLVRVNHGKHL